MFFFHQFTKFFYDGKFLEFFYLPWKMPVVFISLFLLSFLSRFTFSLFHFQFSTVEKFSTALQPQREQNFLQDWKETKLKVMWTNCWLVYKRAKVVKLSSARFFYFHFSFNPFPWPQSQAPPTQQKKNNQILWASTLQSHKSWARKKGGRPILIFSFIIYHAKPL